MSDRWHYWERFAEDGAWRGDQRPPTAALAVLRRGFGREPGSVPELWPYYTRLTVDGRLTRQLRAEHFLLGLYAVHQQGAMQPVHSEKASLGRAVAALRDSGRYSPDAVERRFVAAATAGDVAEVSAHLRSLVHQLKTLPQIQPINYTRLFWDLVSWQDPAKLGRVRREWGSAFYWREPNHQDKPNTEEKERA